MNELNGNEKFFDLPQDLPANNKPVTTIQTGDLMLYGNNTLVLFYQDFKTPYHYTRIGHIREVKGLSKNLGKGNVEVSLTTVN